MSQKVSVYLQLLLRNLLRSLKVIDFDTSREPFCDILANNTKLQCFCRLLDEIYYIFVLLLLLLLLLFICYYYIVLYVAITFLCVLGQGRRLTILYHVMYFGDENVTGWISELHCVPFEGQSSFPLLKSRPDEAISCHNGRCTSLVSKRYQKTWENAVVEAESQLKVRRCSRLRTYCIRGDVEAGGTRRESHGDSPEVSGHGLPSCEQLENQVSVRKRKCRRSSAEDGTLQSVVPRKKARYEQAEVGDCHNVIDNIIYCMFAF